MINVSTNLIAQRVNTLNPASVKSQAVNSPQITSFSDSNLIAQYLNNAAMINSVAVTKSTETVLPYKNDLKTLFLTNSAKILAIVPRTFNAQDTNGNE